MIDWLLQIYIYITIFDVLLSYAPQFRAQSWGQMIRKIADVPQRPLREMMPQNMPLDPTPIIVILLCQMLMYLI